jgi:aspartyl/asparaginyl-tRNA synthetase
MLHTSIQSYNTITSYHQTVQKLRAFFLSRGYLEIDTQSRQSILAACEDPRTIATYTFSGTKWPLPQTGQMWLEDELLRNPHLPGVFCSTTSYRDEPNPNPSRHLKIFPMFEFETHGGIAVLQKLIADLLEWCDFGPQALYQQAEYADVARRYGTKTIEAEHELQLWKELGPIVFLKNFPRYTSPFFNMAQEGDHSKKIDLVAYGVETIGSAERECNTRLMREQFYTISNGGYANILFEHFGKERVERELDQFLSYDFFPRCGGGIGVTRLVRALEMHKQHAIPPYVAAQQQRAVQL